MAADHDPPFKLSHARVTVDQLKRLGKRASEKGRKDEYATTLQIIEASLVADPKAWGEELYTLKHMKLTLYQKVCRGLNLVYAVDTERRIVYLQTVEAMSGSPLAED